MSFIMLNFTKLYQPAPTYPRNTNLFCLPVGRQVFFERGQISEAIHEHKKKYTIGE